MLKNMWSNLDESQKKRYREYCDGKYGQTIVTCETGEPMYMDNEGRLIDTKIIIDLLFHRMAQPEIQK